MLNFARLAFSRFSPVFLGSFLLFTVAFPNALQRLRTPPPKPAAAPVVPPAPFRSGESLTYSGEWLKMADVISAQLTVAGDDPFFGAPAWHLQAQVHTHNPLRYLIPLDDQFDSYSAHSDIVGIQFEMYTHQSGKSESRVLRFSSIQSPAPADATQVQVLPGTRDPLGFAYFLRTINWQQTHEVRSPVYDGHKLYEVHAEAVAPREEITVSAGKFMATGIAIHLFDQGTEKSDVKISVWIADDAPHAPVLFEIETPLSTGRIELVQSAPAH